MHQNRTGDTIARPFQQVPDHRPADAETQHEEPVKAEMVRERELVVGERVPVPFDIERAFGAAAVGIPQVERRHPMRVAERFQRVDGVIGETGDGGVQSAARNHQQRKSVSCFLVIDADGSVFVDRHSKAPVDGAAAAGASFRC